MTRAPNCASAPPRPVVCVGRALADPPTPKREPTACCARRPPTARPGSPIPAISPDAQAAPARCGIRADRAPGGPLSGLAWWFCPGPAPAVQRWAAYCRRGRRLAVRVMESRLVFPPAVSLTRSHPLRWRCPPGHSLAALPSPRSAAPYLRGPCPRGPFRRRRPQPLRVHAAGRSGPAAFPHVAHSVWTVFLCFASGAGAPGPSSPQPAPRSVGLLGTAPRTLSIARCPDGSCRRLQKRYEDSPPPPGGCVQWWWVPGDDPGRPLSCCRRGRLALGLFRRSIPSVAVAAVPVQSRPRPQRWSVQSICGPH